MLHHYLAVDLGAESGRVILGTLSPEEFTLKEIHRFANGMLLIQGKYYWNIGNIYQEILKAMELCVRQEGVQPESIGIDTWGVDFGLLSRDGTLLGLPYAYRDKRTENAMEEFTALINRQEIYSLTGTLFAPYNTLFQLYAAKKYHPELIQAASDLLFIPDLLAYFLTGSKKTEFSFATTSQLFNPTTNAWDKKLFDLLQIPIGIMQEVMEAGSVIGFLDDEVCAATGMNKIPVVAVATHDTNSAIVSIPGTGDSWAFISSGTWSLMGVESDAPNLTLQSYQMNLTNEGGAWHTYNILKNHMGLWLLQQCKMIWKEHNYSYATLIELAASAKEFAGFIDVDDLCFLNPPDMCTTISKYFYNSDQHVAATPGQITRIILECLAFKYRETLGELMEVTGKSIDQIYVTGGGIHNRLLSQFTANATGLIVKTALSEGAAAGNIMMQAVGMGYLHSLSEIRAIIARTCPVTIFQPLDPDKWENAFSRYKAVTASAMSMACK
jgi:rhamnulokinase